MTLREFHAMQDSLLVNARAARKHAETIDPLDLAHLHWHAVADACHDALDQIDKMQVRLQLVPATAQRKD